METVNHIPREMRWQINIRLEDLKYADDLCLLVHTQSEMQQKLESLNAEIKKSFLKINLQKTKEMRLHSIFQRLLVLNGEITENTSNFCYLGSMIATEDETNADV